MNDSSLDVGLICAVVAVVVVAWVAGVCCVEVMLVTNVVRALGDVRVVADVGKSSDEVVAGGGDNVEDAVVTIEELDVVVVEVVVVLASSVTSPKFAMLEKVVR